MKGDVIVSKPVAQRWYQRLNTGEENTKDLPRFGNVNYGILRIYSKFWKKIRKKSNRRMSEELGTSKDTIHRQINTLGNHTAAVDLYLIN